MGWMIRSSNLGRSKIIFSRTSTAALRLIQSLIPWVKGLFQIVKRPECEAGHLPMFGFEIKNESSCTCIAIKWLHGHHRVGLSDP
jgi:hypothetical protein